MASSMLTGERRWVSARRGGMTVLGKVPKPVNLPSQRLENHGLDPNVEIVPKGTLSWGSRSSSSTQNAWGSSSLSSPNTDGGPSSPSYLNGRPSSGGSGTRPSTAGSDRSHEPAPNAWGPSSRPSSASGLLASNQAPMATARPRSAETRPGSSHLSRFAEPISGNSVAWGPSGTTERLGVSSSKMNEFTLSSGDFPTLGSEKNTESHVRQGHSSQGRPVSASDDSATPKERSGTFSAEEESIIVSPDGGAVDTWKKDNSPYGGGGPPPSMDKWHRETQPYSNPNMPPQHFGSSHGPYLHSSPDVVWYQGGPSGGGPCRPPGPPGGYPLESFAYHHPQLPARPLANSQPVPRPGYGPGGYLPNHGDSFRPHVPNSYIQPVMPVRPVVYPGQGPYDGYYGPPDAPIMGMGPTGPCVYNRYPVRNVHPDSGNFHARPGEYDSTRTPMAKEHGDTGHPHNAHQGPYKVLLKQQDGWGGENDRKEKREHIVKTPNLGRGNVPGTPPKKSDNCTNDELVDFSKTVEEDSSVAVGLNLTENMSKAKAGGDASLVPKQETVAISGEAPQTIFSTKRNPTLIDKIEGLNNKARISEGRYDSGHAPREKTKPFRILNAKPDHITNEAEISVISTEKSSTGRVLTPIHEASAPAGEKRFEALSSNATVMSRPVSDLQASTVDVLNHSVGGEKAHTDVHRRPHGVQSRANFRGKGRFNTQEGEEWRKKPHVEDSPIVVPQENVETCPDVCVLEDHHAVQEPSEMFNSNIQAKAGGELGQTSVFYLSDKERATRRENAAQRAKELQKEEEERIREQNARARAKLEELDRRKLAESSIEKSEHSLPPSGALQHKQEDYQSKAGPVTAVNSSTNVSTDLPKSLPLEVPPCAPPDDVITNLTLPLRENTKDVTDHRTTQVNDTSAPSKHRQMGYKRKQSNLMDKNLNEKSIPTGNAVGGPKSHDNAAGINVNASGGESNFPSNSNAMDDSLQQQHKKKNIRSGKNKHKFDEVSSSSMILPSLVPVKGIAAKDSAESSKPKTPESVLEVSTVQAETSQNVVPFTDQGWLSLPIEEAHSKENHLSQLQPQPQPQPPRRMPRKAQTTRTMDKFHGSDNVVWAPVRSQNKNDASEEAGHNNTIEVQSPSAIAHGTQNNPKSRRAEMERYVPKPVAKEMSQQGNMQRPSSPIVNQASSNEITETKESGPLITENSEPGGGSSVGKGGFAVVSTNGENKDSKLGKTQGSWRQRGSLSNNRQEKYPDNHNEQVTGPDVKDHGVTGRGKRQPFKGQKGMLHNHNNLFDDSHGEDTFKSGTQSEANKPSQLERKIVVGENQIVIQHGSSSHWQPKSQAYVGQNRHGSRGNGNDRVVSQVDKAPEKEYHPPEGGQLHPDWSNPQKPIVAEVQNIHHQVAKGEKKGGIDSSENVDNQHEQSFSSGLRRHGHHNGGRFGRGGHEVSRGGGRGPSVKDNNSRQQHLPANSDGRRNSSHYEYKPAGSSNNEHGESFEEDSRNKGSRYRERSQTHQRRGGGANFYGRSSGALTRVSDSYASGE